MPERRSYKQTLFDRYGPDAGAWIKAAAYGMSAGGTVITAYLLIAAQGGAPITPKALVIVVLAAIGVAIFATVVPIWLSETTGTVVQEVVLSGSTTPYTQQHSYQQALVMQGRLDEALASLEAVIIEADSSVDVRIRAAELYTREAKNHIRAAELFREAMQHPKCAVGEDVYSTHRLVDLLNGPLGDKGRALVELRHLMIRYPDTAIAARAKEALMAIKFPKNEPDLFVP